jgi:hypothetical protein
MTCPPNVTGVVTDSGQAFATIGGGGFSYSIASFSPVPSVSVPATMVTLSGFTPQAVVATDNAGLVGFTVKRVVPAVNASCGPAFLGAPQTVVDACAQGAANATACAGAGGGGVCAFVAASQAALVSVVRPPPFPAGFLYRVSLYSNQGDHGKTRKCELGQHHLLPPAFTPR